MEALGHRLLGVHRIRQHRHLWDEGGGEVTHVQRLKSGLGGRRLHGLLALRASASLVGCTHSGRWERQPCAYKQRSLRTHTHPTSTPCAHLRFVKVGLASEVEQEVEVGQAGPVGRCPPLLQVRLELGGACGGGRQWDKPLQKPQMCPTCAGRHSQYLSRCGAATNNSLAPPTRLLRSTSLGLQPTAQPPTLKQQAVLHSKPPSSNQRQQGSPFQHTQCKQPPTLGQQAVLHRELVLQRSLVVLHRHRHLGTEGEAAAFSACPSMMLQRQLQGPSWSCPANR